MRSLGWHATRRQRRGLAVVEWLSLLALLAVATVSLFEVMSRAAGSHQSDIANEVAAPTATGSDNPAVAAD